MLDERVREELTGVDTAPKATQDNDSFHSFESDNYVSELKKPDEQANESMASSEKETEIKSMKYQSDGKARKKMLIDWREARKDAQKKQNDPQPTSPVSGGQDFIKRS